MKLLGILVLLVVVEMFAPRSDARFISSSQAHDYVDTEPVSPPTWTCYADYLKGSVTTCDCFAYVNDPSSGIKGNFTFITVYLGREVIVGLLLDKKLVVAETAEIHLSDRYTVVACNQSEVTKGKSVCLVMDGERSKDTKRVTECVRIESPPLNVNLGCFSFLNENINEEIQLDGSLKLVDAKQND